jgi:hypothetical protein
MARMNKSLRRRKQQDAAALWISNCKVAQAVRLMGALPEPEGGYLILYVPVPPGKVFVEDLASGGKIAFLYAVIHDNPSFQFTGTCASYWPSTEAEVKLQRSNVKG